jgi:hypothetical protein
MAYKDTGLMVRELTPQEKQEFIRNTGLIDPISGTWMPIPEDGFLDYMDGIGCVAVFQKTDGHIIMSEVSDVFPTCTRQTVPTKLGSAAKAFITDAIDRSKSLSAQFMKVLQLVLVILIIWTIIQSGILKKVFA